MYKKDEKHKIRHRKTPDEVVDKPEREAVIRKLQEELEFKRKVVELRTAKKPKFIDDDFDQIEPKYFPHLHEETREMRPNSNEDRKTRIHNERARRLHHMRGSAGQEQPQEKENLVRDLDSMKVDPEQQQHPKQQKNPWISLDNIKVEMVKDGSHREGKFYKFILTNLQ